MKKIYLLVVFFCVLTNVQAQDWLQNSSSLYYYSGNGKKVYMQPDYSSMAVYFKDTPSLKTVQSFKSKISLFKSASGNLPDAQSMGAKGVVRLKSSDGLMSIKTAEQRKLFLSTYNLETEEAYDVLPSFSVQGTQAWLTKRVVIKLANTINLNDIEETLQKYDATLVKEMLKGKMFLLEISELENQLPLIQELTEAGSLEWGTPDFKMEVKLFNDPFFDQQWHLNNEGGLDYSGFFELTEDVDIDAPEAWEITTGSSDITVAVIDDGLNAHEDFPSLLTGYTPANNGDGTPESDGAHGVACGGLIFAQHNDLGVMGVAPDVNAFSVNIFAAGTSNADLAVGIIWAVDQGADVLSNSWGFSGCFEDDALPDLLEAFEYAATEGRDGLGCIILVASGNDYEDCVSYPASMEVVTAVGAVNGQGERSQYSNYGSKLDITGPSNDVDFVNQVFISNMVTTDVQGSLGYVDGNYEFDFGGTSAATPVVAGVAALVLSVDPTLTKSEVEEILYDSAVDYGSNGFDNEYGNGLVNAYNAVIAAGGTIDDGGSEETEFPDITKKYYIDSAHFDYRIAASGESEEPYTTATSTTGDDVEWVFVEKGNGYWHIQRAEGGSLPRLRTDNSEFADMQGTAWSGSYTYYELTEGYYDGSYFVTLPDGPTDYKRLQINRSGEIKMVPESSALTWESFNFTEVDEATTSSVISTEIADLKIYPNEVESVLNVSFSESETVSKIEVVDLFGQTYKSENINSNEASLDVSNLTNGLYLVRLYNGDSVLESKRILKK